jgi:hypothetical protein
LLIVGERIIRERILGYDVFLHMCALGVPSGLGAISEEAAKNPEELGIDGWILIM